MSPQAQEQVEGRAPRRPLPPGSFRLVTFAGVEVRVSNSWFLIVGLIAFVMAPRIEREAPNIGAWAYLIGVAVAVLLYLSVLLHEISHAVAGLAFKMPVHSINLHFLGGATEIEGEATTPWREFVIAVVGPLTSLAIGGLALACVDLFDQGLVRFAVAALAGANLIVGVINLVPGLPLDGGRVLQAAIWAVSGRRGLGVVVAAWGGRLAAVAAFTYPFLLPAFGLRARLVDYFMGFVIGAFLWAGASQALTSAKVRSKLPSLDARRMGRPAIGVPATLPLAEGIRQAQLARAGSIVVVAADGCPMGIVNEAAVMSTPEGRRPWVSCGDLARRIEDGLMISADLTGEALLRTLNTTPASEYVLVEPDGSVYGVLVAKDVDAAYRAA
ncbi:MAG: M50 family metallopeptidase [Nocardioidaceae bacterium]|nr:M50 family metallopeptidase [Nocardioidaceae bacterium]